MSGLLGQAPNCLRHHAAHVAMAWAMGLRRLKSLRAMDPAFATAAADEILGDMRVALRRLELAATGCPALQAMQQAAAPPKPEP
ncbi:hypothetical protein G3N55_00025 [Dissulfurirhabdus thermomarina]|uniref:Uncharacterized protein n=1 Tax=Dissulfurirhabdus thermomarina TaxID=1765737 RepID=A0A6N9TRM9_DISTH|nr:hypothetical protein [Dissulfurirhabdus thermomarina]NDY41236.1 hypothetical protein [Dissulfurirhabdus thermomarina]